MLHVEQDMTDSDMVVVVLLLLVAVVVTEVVVFPSSSSSSATPLTVISEDETEFVDEADVVVYVNASDDSFACREDLKEKLQFWKGA